MSRSKPKHRTHSTNLSRHKVSLNPIGPPSSLKLYLSASWQSAVIASVATPRLRRDSGTSISSICTLVGTPLSEFGLRRIVAPRLVLTANASNCVQRTFPISSKINLGDLKLCFILGSDPYLRPARKLFFRTLQIIEFLCNASDVVQELSLEDIKALEPLLKSPERLPEFVRNAVLDYQDNKGTRGWDFPDRKIVPLAWNDAARSF